MIIFPNFNPFGNKTYSQKVPSETSTISIEDEL
jgi:hypothetical protein